MFLTKQELLLDWSVISKVYHKKYFKSRQFKLRTMQLLTQKQNQCKSFYAQVQGLWESLVLSGFFASESFQI